MPFAFGFIFYDQLIILDYWWVWLCKYEMRENVVVCHGLSVYFSNVGPHFFFILSANADMNTMISKRAAEKIVWVLSLPLFELCLYRLLAVCRHLKCTYENRARGVSTRRTCTIYVHIHIYIAYIRTRVKKTAMRTAKTSQQHLYICVDVSSQKFVSGSRHNKVNFCTIWIFYTLEHRICEHICVAQRRHTCVGNVHTTNSMVNLMWFSRCRWL